MTRRITRIAPRRRGGLYAVDIDGSYAFDVDDTTLYTLRLREGEPIDPETEARARSSADLNRAKERALRLLEVRGRSKRELVLRLERAGFSGPTIEAVVAWLVSLGYLDDRRFADEWVRSRTARKPLGPRRLRYELQRLGVDRSVVDGAVGAIEDEHAVELALRAAAPRVRRRRDLPPEEWRRKTYAFLLRRGFDGETIEKALARLEESER